MRKPEGLSFYKRLALNKYLSINPSTNGVSVSIGIPGARAIIPVVAFTERPPMVNIQRYGIRYRRHIVDVASLLDEAKDVAAEDAAAAARLYRKAERYARSERERAEASLGKGYTGRRSYGTIEELVTPEDYRKLGAIIRGDYARFVDIIEELRKKREKMITRCARP